MKAGPRAPDDPEASALPPTHPLAASADASARPLDGGEQVPLFDAVLAPDACQAPAAVLPVAHPPQWQALADALRERFEGRLRLGTSSWHFPGWQGWVWAGRHAEGDLSRHGLAAYARHPLLRTVSLDRAFYRPLESVEYARLAAQVPDDFRFVVKAPAIVTDAVVRDPATARPVGDNARFLDPEIAVSLSARPAAEGLGPSLGALVLQLSPLPARWLNAPADLQLALDRLLAAVGPQLPSGAVLAVEPRDAALCTPDWAVWLRSRGARLVLGLHDRMPPADLQLPALRAAWPGDLVCRWNLQRGQRYAQARDRWAPFHRLAVPDEATRLALARVVLGTLRGGCRALVTINNKAEGCAPASVLALAEAILQLDDATR